MERGISHATANESLVSAARNVVQHDFGDVESQAGIRNPGVEMFIILLFLVIRPAARTSRGQ